MVLIYMSAVAVEDMHGRVLFKIDVCLSQFLSVLKKKATNKKVGTD